MIYSINITPHYNKITNEPIKAKVYFETNEGKSDYIRKELSFCAKERNAFMDSNNHHPAHTHKAYMAKRVAFAVSNGFKPGKGLNSNIWTYQPNSSSKDKA